MADNSSSRNDRRMQSSSRNVQYPLSSPLSFLSPSTTFPYPHLPPSWIHFLGRDGEDSFISMENFKRIKYLNYVDVKQEEFSLKNQLLYNGPYEPSLSPTNKSCITSSNGSVLNFSNNKTVTENHHHHLLDQQSSPECNSARGGEISKKARFSSSSQHPFKARKEKLGDRITALHQLVSPFGKTDTASVLLEAIGYIRFLQTQIEALSSPYLATGTTQQQNDGEGSLKDLRSIGLCLVPVSRVG